VLSANNTFSGGMSTSAGVLSIGNAGALGSGTLRVTGSSTLRTSGANYQIGNPVNLQGGTWTLGAAGSGNLDLAGAITLISANRTISVAAGGNHLISGVIGEDVAGRILTKTGSGTLILGAPNTLSGGFTVAGGTLSIANDSAVGSGTLRLSGGSLRSSDSTPRIFNNPVSFTANSGVAGSGALTFQTGAWTLNGNRTLTVNNTATTTIASAIGEDITGGRMFTKAGAGTLVLSGANSITGGFRVSAGTLTVANDTALGTGTLTLNGGTLQSDSARVFDNPVLLSASSTLGGSAAMTFQTGAWTISGGNRTLTIGNTTTTTISSSIGEDVLGRRLTLAGAETLVLSGANTFSGGLTINSGTLKLGNDSAAGTGIFVMNGGIIGGNNATPRSLANPVTLSADTTMAGPADLTYHTGGWTLSGGNHTLTVDNNTTVSSPISEDVAGRALIMAGNGTLTLSGNNSFSGGFTVASGTAVLAGVGALGGVSGNVILDPGASLSFQAAGDKINNLATLALNGGTVQLNHFAEDIGVLSLNGDSTIEMGTFDGTSRDITFSSAVRVSGTLTIDNWAGSESGGTADRIFVTAAPGSDFLQNVTFSGFNAGAQWLGATQELVPAPEPQQTALVVAAILFLGAGIRRCTKRGRFKKAQALRTL